MAAGRALFQANDGKVATVTFEDGAAGNVTVTLPKEGGVLTADAEVVHKTGDETIAGVKTFSNNTILSGNVGIGLSNPAEKMDVVGNIRAFMLYGSRSSASAVVAGGLGVAIDGTLQCQIVSPASSTMAMLTGGVERLRIDTSGNVLVTGSGGLGYGVGSGGTVTQLTSKSTAVTLNKPCGQITMNNASLAAGTSVTFLVNNSTVSIYDLISVSSQNTNDYSVILSTVVVGGFYIRVTNITSVAIAASFYIDFAVIKGVTA